MRICREFQNWRDLRALSGKFLRQKSCYPESFRFLWLCTVSREAVGAFPQRFEYHVLHFYRGRILRLGEEDWAQLHSAQLAQHSLNCSVILKMAEKLQELSLKGLNTVSCRTRCGAGAPSRAASVLMVLYCGEVCPVLVLWAVFRRVLCAMRSCRRVQMCYEELWELFRPSRHPGRGRWARLPRPKPSSSSLSPVYRMQ